MPPQTSQPEQDKKSPPLFTKTQLYAIYITLGFFVMSSVASLLLQITKIELFFSPLVLFWFMGAFLGFVITAASFVRGLARMFRDKGVMLVSSI